VFLFRVSFPQTGCPLWLSPVYPPLNAAKGPICFLLLFLGTCSSRKSGAPLPIVELSPVCCNLLALYLSIRLTKPVKVAGSSVILYFGSTQCIDCVAGRSKITIDKIRILVIDTIATFSDLQAGAGVAQSV
jgi:hypothetical protein